MHPGLNKATNKKNTKLTTKIYNSDSLHPSEQGDSINMSPSNDERWVMAVVAKVRYKQPKIRPTWGTNNPVIVEPVTKSS